MKDITFDFVRFSGLFQILRELPRAFVKYFVHFLISDRMKSVSYREMKYLDALWEVTLRKSYLLLENPQFTLWKLETYRRSLYFCLKICFANVVFLDVSSNFELFEQLIKKGKVLLKTILKLIDPVISLQIAYK